MANVYSLNPQVLPSTPLPKEEHHRVITASIICAVIVVVLGLLYWRWAYTRQAPQAAVDNEAKLKAEVAAILTNSSVKPSQKEIDDIASQLSKSKVSASTDLKQRVASQLQQGGTGEF